MWLLCKENPCRRISEYRNELKSIVPEFQLSPSYIARIFQGWKWTWKKPQRNQIQKYTANNISYYGIYLGWILGVPWNRLRFVDEAHCVSKGKFLNFYFIIT